MNEQHLPPGLLSLCLIAHSMSVHASPTPSAARVALPDIDIPCLTWLVVGDLSSIEAGIRKLDVGEVKVLDVDGNALR
jgi:hypothetical protein